MITSKRRLNSFSRILSNQDKTIKSLMDKFGPCTMSPWKNDPFTQLIGSITSQQLSVKAASTIFSRVKTACKTDVFIEPDRLLGLTPETLRKCGLSRSKTQYIIGIAEAVVSENLSFKQLINKSTEAVVSERLSFKQLINKSTEEVITELVRLKGIGIWTAEMFSMFSLGHADILATDDLGLKKGMQIILDSDKLPDKKQMEQRAEIWRPYRSIASWYLWRLLENN